jgi:hypothetical protein
VLDLDLKVAVATAGVRLDQWWVGPVRVEEGDGARPGESGGKD